jgi:4,5-DOPA dioxygenase extradiol
VSSILSFEDHPDAARSHPSNEHFLPVLFAIGAALPGDEVDVFYRGVQYESLSMVCFSLNTAITQQFH